MSADSQGMKAGRALILALALQAAASPGANAAAAQPAITSPTATQQTDNLDELDQVLVSGRKAVRKPSIILAWMRRLVGEFTYEGQVDLRGQGNPEELRKVQGRGHCTGFGPAPGVYCEIDVRWPETKGSQGEEIPGGISNLAPAMMLFGFEPDDLGIRYMLVDSKGIAEPALGLLIDDTLTSKEPCVNTPVGCQKVTRITAEPEGKVIKMQIDVEMNYKPVLSYRFVLRRTPDVQTGDPPRVTPP